MEQFGCVIMLTPKNNKGVTMKSEIAVIKRDIEYLKQNFNDIKPMISKMYDTFIRGDGKIKELRNDVNKICKDLDGNGKKGLKEQINDLRNQIAYYVGGLAVFVTIVTIIVNVLW
jgi:t-SNARE complex subunit (syntaxin)